MGALFVCEDIYKFYDPNRNFISNPIAFILRLLATLNNTQFSTMLRENMEQTTI